MIRYDLTCANQHGFDSWFRDSDGFDQQLADRNIVCPVCGSGDVAKALMTPGLGSRSNRKKPDQPPANGPDPQQLAAAIRTLRQHVETSADYVGDRFAEEARRIYYQETKKRGIYGEATLQDARDLNEEGIDVVPLPPLPEDQN